MDTSFLELGPGRLRAILDAQRAVADALASAHGRRQFYALSQVRAALADVGSELQPWVLAVFVTRADFDAWFALRDTPGSYEQLRAALVRCDMADVPEWRAREVDVRATRGDVLWWLASLVD